MKALLCILTGTMLASFAGKPVNHDDLDGYWMGYCRSDVTKIKVIIKLDDNQRMEYFTGGIDDRTRVEGTYKITGDSVVIAYKSSSGESILMEGHYSWRRNYIEGVCKTNNQRSGNFFIEKQKFEERIVKP